MYFTIFWYILVKAQNCKGIEIKKKPLPIQLLRSVVLYGSNLINVFAFFLTINLGPDIGV